MAARIVDGVGQASQNCWRGLRDLARTHALVFDSIQDEESVRLESTQTKLFLKWL